MLHLEIVRLLSPLGQGILWLINVLNIFYKTKLVHMSLGRPVIISCLSYFLSNLTFVAFDFLAVEDSYLSLITELKQAMFLNQGWNPKVNISHARTQVSPRFSN